MAPAGSHRRGDGRRRRFLFLLALGLAPFAVVAAPDAALPGAVTRGKVSWYGAAFAARRTASGEPFDPEALTMAHRTLPFGTRVKVTNLRNRRSVVVRVNDRGPNTAHRIGDVSAAAATQLGMQRAGVVEATLEVVGGEPAGPGRSR